MTELSPDVFARLRAFAAAPPVSAEDLNEATRCVRLACPDFAFAGIGMNRRATFTLGPGASHQLSGRTHGDLLSQAAALITGREADRVERRREKGK